MRGLLSLLLLLASCQILTAQFTCLRGDCQETHSVCVYPEGYRYEGDFQGGLPHGLGVMDLGNGDRYVGDFYRQRREGKGRMFFQNGDHYLGAFVRNKMEGYGEMNYSGGAYYEGSWLANFPHGLGKMKFPTGDRYEGKFVRGMFHGQGTMQYADGSSYQGEWQYNQRHGQGRGIDLNGIEEEGWWRNDQFAGDAVETDVKMIADLDTAYLRNCNLEFCLAGRGSFTYRNGTHYIGEFMKGVPEGKGKVFYTNGDKYEGGWVKHQPEGRGTMYYKSGQSVQAIWEGGKTRQILGESATQAETNNGTDVRIWAVVVGAAQYLHMPALRYTDDDAYQLYAFLKSPQGGAVPDRQLRLLIDEDATKAGILNAMQQVYAQADENDVVVFYFSGHGIEGAFLPVDYDGSRNQILHEDIRRTIEKSRAKHKIVVADACHSGGLFLRRTSTQEVLRKYYSSFEKTNGGTALLMSSKGEEFSLEDSGLRSGVFSHFFIKGLKGAADQDESGVISVNEIYQYVYRNVRMYTGNVQTPLLLGDFDKRMPIGAVY